MIVENLGQTLQLPKATDDIRLKNLILTRSYKDKSNWKTGRNHFFKFHLEKLVLHPFIGKVH